MRNSYAGVCFLCGKPVKAGDGWFQTVGSLPKNERKNHFGKKWVLRCRRCKDKGNRPIDLIDRINN